MALLTSVLRGDVRLASLGLRDWEVLLGQARVARLAGRVAQCQIDQGGLVAAPPGPRRYLQGVLYWLESQHQRLRWELHCLRQCFAGQPDMPLVLLKGAAYAAADLPAARGRLFADIDLMVPRERLDEAEGLLLGGGWVSEERDPYNQRYYREWMHEIPPLTHVQRHTVIDLHHTITAPTSRFAVPGAELLAHCVPVPGWPGFLQLQPVDMVLHSAAHLFQEGEFDHGLRDLVDLDELLRDFQRTSGFWPQLLQRARALGLEVPLHHALAQLEHHLGRLPPVDSGVSRRALGVGWSSRWPMQMLLSRALEPEHPSCARAGDRAVRLALYVRSHWLRMPVHLLLPHLVRKAWMRSRAEPQGHQP